MGLKQQGYACRVTSKYTSCCQRCQPLFILEQHLVLNVRPGCTHYFYSNTMFLVACKTLSHLKFAIPLCNAPCCMRNPVSLNLWCSTKFCVVWLYLGPLSMLHTERWEKAFYLTSSDRLGHSSVIYCFASIAYMSLKTWLRKSIFVSE